MPHAPRLLLGVVLLSALASNVAAADPAPPAGGTGVGLLLPQGPADRIVDESDLACELAGRLTSATVILPAGGGKFVDRDGRSVSLDSLKVIWCHQGDVIDRTGPLYDDAAIQALRAYVAAGGGLLLSGGAVAMVEPLGIDKIRTKPQTFGHDRGQAGLIPLAAAHPAFRGVDLDRGVLWMSNAAFPAFAEFHPASSPARGMLLAETPGGPENPLVEYSLDKGRVVAMGWRLGKLYGEAAPAYRDNFEHLATNLLAYLADCKVWQDLAMSADGRPLDVEPTCVGEEEFHSLELALADLVETFKDRYPKGPDYLRRLADLRKAQADLLAKLPPRAGTPLRLRQAAITAAAPALADLAHKFAQLRSEALLANPLMDFQRLLLVKRGEKQLGLPLNYSSNSSLPPKGYDNQIATLSPARPDGKLSTLYKPQGAQFVGDVRLHFDADKMLFSMTDANGRWNVCEIHADGSGFRQLPLIREGDVDNYDACYLPDGRIIFTSTACFAGVPCVNGSGHVANLYLQEADGKIRQLTVEQDHDWCPTVLNNGKILYLRWEYTDIPHAFSRRLFHMNPDGTEQMEYYGSNSYWPNSMFFARPIPNHPTKVVAICGTHHEYPRMGDMVIFDPAIGRYEAEGAVQKIPGRGRKVSPTMMDLCIGQTWPKFLHPYPLGEAGTGLGAGKYFLASCKPSADATWGIYLVDVFDNVVLVYQESGYAMLEPIPLQKTPRPPVVPDKVDLSRKDAEVLIADIYRGQGLSDVPRGTVKSLRLISYEFGYQGMGAEPYSVGLDGPWDPKRVLGTVPVYEDGSAHFRVPAYTPISMQPLDAEGKAVQLMRSWMTAMPGEVVSCIGCHEKLNTSPPVRTSIGAGQPASEIKPWYGPVRGFAFCREVQPVLDKYCLCCHNGKARPDGKSIPDFTDGPPVPTLNNKNGYNLASRFSPSYYQLRRFVRTPTKESDIRVLTPWDFHSDTTRLVQILQKGHYGVSLDAEAWDRLITWIDLNAPCHGTWGDIRGREIGPAVAHQTDRRRQMRKLYTGMDEDPEITYGPANLGKPVVPASQPAASARVAAIELPGWPFDAQTALRRQRGESNAPTTMSVPLGGGVSLELARIPSGEFLMGQADGLADERPVSCVKISSAFWMGRCEVTNEQFARFDPTHDSRIENGDYIQFSPGERGWALSRPKQPVVRVSWRQAMAYCQWLSQKTGRTFTLPTEGQWEYACRAGTATPLWYGTLDTDFSPFANVSDASHAAVDPFGWSGRPLVIPPWRPADTRFDDKNRVSATVGSYRANPWGLFDMHGNVAEWTRSEYRPYPYKEDDGRNDANPDGRKTVRGGSWYDKPDRCRSAFREVYPAARPVYDVGFRVICE